MLVYIKICITKNSEKICGNTDVLLGSRNTYIRSRLECGDIQYIVRKSDKARNVKYQPGSAVS